LKSQTIYFHSANKAKMGGIGGAKNANQNTTHQMLNIDALKMQSVTKK
jgi:hypothetical protein